MSKLFDAIKKCIDAFGKDIIKDKKIVNILADYHAYDGKPAFKHVFSAIVNGGYAKHLLDGKNQQVQIMRDIAEISNDLTERIMRLKGVEHVKLTSTANGEEFSEPGHSHEHGHHHH